MRCRKLLDTFSGSRENAGNGDRAHTRAACNVNERRPFATSSFQTHMPYPHGIIAQEVSLIPFL